MTNRIVTVKISATVPTYLMKYVGPASANISVTASAKVKGGDPLCVIGLNTNANSTIKMDMNAKLQAPGCVVYSNSTKANGLMAMNNATLTAAMICSAGGKSARDPAVSRRLADGLSADGRSPRRPPRTGDRNLHP